MSLFLTYEAQVELAHEAETRRLRDKLGMEIDQHIVHLADEQGIDSPRIRSARDGLRAHNAGRRGRANCIYGNDACPICPREDE